MIWPEGMKKNVDVSKRIHVFFDRSFLATEHFSDFSDHSQSQ